MALLILAIAQLRFGSPLQAGRDHVIVLDVSAWMSARSGNNRTLMDDARVRARRYLHAVPARDRVMLVRADALTTPPWLTAGAAGVSMRMTSFPWSAI